MRNFFALLAIVLFTPYSWGKVPKIDNIEVRKILGALPNSKVLVDALVTYQIANKSIYKVFQNYGIDLTAPIPKASYRNGLIQIEGFKQFFDMSKAHTGIFRFGNKEIALNWDLPLEQNIDRLYRFLAKNLKTASHIKKLLFIEEAWAEETDFDKFPGKLLKKILQYGLSGGVLLYGFIKASALIVSGIGLVTTAKSVALVIAALLAGEYLAKRYLRDLEGSDYRTVICFGGNLAFQDKKKNDEGEWNEYIEINIKSKTRLGRGLERVFGTNLSLVEQFVAQDLCKDSNPLGSFSKAVNWAAKYIVDLKTQDSKAVEHEDLFPETHQ